MSTTELPTAASAADEADSACAQCGAELADDQEWCLECGGARTLIHRGPDWRVPLLVIGTVIVLAIGGFVVALIAISDNSGNPATTTITSSAAASRASTSTNATSAGTTNGGAASTAAGSTAAGSAANIASWPVARSGWTVVLASARTRADAYRVAQRVAGQGIEVGVLDSSEHPSLAPGYWIVFSGRYATRAGAQSASTQLISLGQPAASPQLVGH